MNQDCRSGVWQCENIKLHASQNIVIDGAAWELGMAAVYFHLIMLY